MQQTYEDIASEVNELLHKMDPMGPTSPVPTEFLAGGSQATLQLKELKGQPPCCTRLLSRWPCCVILLIFGLFAAAATVVAVDRDWITVEAAIKTTCSTCQAQSTGSRQSSA